MGKSAFEEFSANLFWSFMFVNKKLTMFVLLIVLSAPVTSNNGIQSAAVPLSSPMSKANTLSVNGKKAKK